MNRFLFSLVLLSFISCAHKSQTERKFASDVASSIDCKDKVVMKSSAVRECSLDAGDINKKFYIFEGKGTLAEIQYAHGYLLAPQIDHGSIEEMLAYFDSQAANLGKNRWLFDSLKVCYMNRLRHSVSPEFKDAIKAVAAGYEAGMKAKGLKPRFTADDFEFGLLGIEMGNVLTGLMHNVDEKVLEGARQLISACGLKVGVGAIKNLLAPLKKVPAHDQKMGCIGFAASSSATGDALIHARNLDQSPLMGSWGKTPVIYIINETGHTPYVATGTAGLIYPGGISGFNEKGIAVSLHQMNTTRYDSKHKEGSAEVLPFLMQRVLRETSSIDEAFALIKKTNVFSSWTIFITDSKTQEIASIEISAKRKVIARRVKNGVMGQSNHYLAPEMQKEHFHATLSAYLETQSRLKFSTDALQESEGRIDREWMMDHLAAHIDAFEGERSFGKTAVKVSNLMSSIAIPTKNEMWMTLATHKPAAHSWYAGVRADFKNNTLTVIGSDKTYAFENRPSYEKSFSYYVDAYMTYRKGDQKKAAEILEQARELALKDGYADPTYHYNLARIYMKQENYELAQERMSVVLDEVDELHPYHQALVRMYSGYIIQKLGDKSKSKFRPDALWNIAEKTLEKEVKDATHAKVNLKRKLKFLKTIMKGKEPKKVPALDFTVVD